jgi:hypothetical protein
MVVPVTMSRHAFDSMNDASLIWACVEPIIMSIRGRDIAAKSYVYAHLSVGQRALLMFQILRGHTSSGVMEFFQLIPYMPSKEGIWQEMQTGMRYFKDDVLRILLGEIEADYHAIKDKNVTEGFDGLMDDDPERQGEDSELLQSVGRHDRLLRNAIPRSEELIAAHIRSNWTEFVSFQE